MLRFDASLWFLSTFSYLLFFFFQAEDGIRDDLVTGVQTCALPISEASDAPLSMDRARLMLRALLAERFQLRLRRQRSEERRVGKECRSRWSAAQYKENNRTKRGKHSANKSA